MKNILLIIAVAATCTSARADNWMRNLPDDAYVAEVSIPGAHDSGTGNGCGRVFVIVDGTPFAQTQDIAIADQWSAGVRAFDLRPCTTSSGYLNINHGIVPTNLRFDTALQTLRDSLEANPTEFAVIHLLHESDGDSGNYDYETLLHQLLDSDEYKDYLVDYRRNLTVSDMRGKILILYRDSYTTQPTGGLMTGWTGSINWSAQTSGKITGAGSDANASGKLYMQDFSDTSGEGDVERKVSALQTMLDFSTAHMAQTQSDIVWVFNFASAYSQMASILNLVDVSLADGYRDNATYTNKAIIDYLNNQNGPTGIVLADYVGVDTSTGNDGNSYQTMGKTLVETIIQNNFKYLQYIPTTPYEALQQELENIADKDITVNVGTATFQIPQEYADTLSQAITAATITLSDPNATEEEINNALTSLLTAEENLNNAPLIKPDEDDIFNITLVADGFTYGGNPLTFYEGTNTTTGNYGLTFQKEADQNYGQAYTFTPQESTINGYTISFTDVQGDTRYLCLGTAYNSNATNIRTTTEPDDAYVFQVVATTTESGIWHIYNQETQSNIGSSGGSSLTSTDIYCNLSLTPAQRLSIMPEIIGGWTTICLPFSADIPDGWTAYTCETLADDEVTLNLQQAERINANTPYIASCPTEQTFTGTGTYYSTYTTTAGLLAGTMEETTIGEGNYTLSCPDDPGVAFYITPSSGITLAPYQCYISTKASTNPIIYIPGTATCITSTQADKTSSTIYDLQGRKVTAPKTGIYIANGKKVLVK